MHLTKQIPKLVSAFTLVLVPLTICAQYTVIVKHKAAGGSFTLRYPTPAFNYSTSSSVAVSLSSKPISAGDLLVYQCSGGSGSVISSVSNGGTLQIAQAAMSSVAQGEQLSAAYILSAAAETGTDTITLTGSSGYSECAIWDYSYTGTPAFDGANVTWQSASSSTITVPTFTPSPRSTNDISLQFEVVPWTKASGISSPFTMSSAGNDAGFAYLNNSASASGPTWTWGSPQTPILASEIQFGYNVTTPQNMTFVNMSGTNGSTVTAATLAGNTSGARLGNWFQSGSCSFTYETAASQPLSGSTGRLSDGSKPTDSSTTGIELAGGSGTGSCNWNVGSSTNYGPMSTAATVTAGMNVYIADPVTNENQIDSFGFGGTYPGDFVNAMIVTNGAQMGVSLECGSGQQGLYVLSQNTWYHFEAIYSSSSSGTHYLKVYSGWQSPSSPGTLLTTQSCQAEGYYPSHASFGNSNSAAMPSNAYIYFDSMLVSLDGTDPL